MERMGHSTSRAALIYLHSTSARQHHLADAVTARARSELGKTDKPPFHQRKQPLQVLRRSGGRRPGGALPVPVPPAL
jgi:hypothetical protein